MITTSLFAIARNALLGKHVTVLTGNTDVFGSEPERATGIVSDLTGVHADGCYIELEGREGDIWIGFEEPIEVEG